MREAEGLGRRLRFDVHMRRDESIPGAIARGVRAHVLFSTRPVLTAADVRMKHIGHAQIGERDELERLAHVARCDPGLFAANAGARVRHAGWSKSTDVRFGRFVMPRAHLELDKRRISPLSIREADHHRLTWMNLLLPYCPESLERLVDTCDDCGSTLGWHYARGIGTCEHCGEAVAPAKQDPLPDELANDYRLFAALSSPSEIGRADAAIALPPTLRDVEPGTLVQLAIHVGGLAQSPGVATTDRLAIRRLEGPFLAKIASTGVAMLRSWPQSLRDWTSASAARRSDDHDGLRALRSRLQQLTNRNRVGPDLADLVADALPDLRSHAVHGFSSGERYYLYKQVQKKLRLDNAQTEALRDWAGPRYRCVDPGNQHRRGRFDAGLVDPLVPIFEGAVPFNRCSSQFRLPLYGIDHLCAAGLLERIEEPAYVLVKGDTSISRSSLYELIETLRAARQTDPEPTDATSLSMSSRRLGGRLKPWASIIGAFVDGSIPFWLRGHSPDTMTIRVRSQDLDVFDTISDVATSDWIGSKISQADAAEVLNIKSTVLRDISSYFDLVFETNGLALTTQRDAILDVAAAVAWNAEIAWHLGIRFDKVDRILSTRRIPRISTGWSRRHLIDERILPDLGKVPSPTTSPNSLQTASFDECKVSADLVSA